jgi:hypothetical protein
MTDVGPLLHFRVVPGDKKAAYFLASNSWFPPVSTPGSVSGSRRDLHFRGGRMALWTMRSRMASA